METIPVKEVKAWAKANLPPMAWQRVTFRVLPQLNKMNVFLHYFEDDNYLLSDDVFKLLNQTFLETFKKQLQFATPEIVATAATEALVEPPKVEQVAEILLVEPPKVEQVAEILPVEPLKVEQVAEVLPVEPLKVEQVSEILPVEPSKVEQVAEVLPKEEEKKEEEKPISKPFVPFFSLEQLKRIFSKKD